ncbi:MAG: methyl-accepting chemotaxis protein, partial [Pseudomonadota bacterium]
MSVEETDKLELTRLRSAVQGTLTAIMMVDRDLVVTYVNGATQKLLAEHSEDFAAAFPGFDADEIVGTCIDVFHKNPKHQRKMLADASNLPHSVDIHVGDLTFNINVTAQHDDDGEYIGNTLEWYDVTADRASEEQS